MRLGLGDDLLDGRVVRDIARQGLGASALGRDVARHARDQRAIARHQHDGGAGGGERAGRALAQAAAGAGDERDLSVQFIGHGTSCA